MGRDIFKEEGIDYQQPNQNVGRDIFKEEGIDASPANQGALHNFANGAGVNFVLGAGDSARRQLVNVLNVVPDAINEGYHLLGGKGSIPLGSQHAPSSGGAAYNIGQGVGDIGGYVAAIGNPEIAAPKALPAAERIAKLIAGFGKPALKAGAYEAIQHPEDRIGAAEEAAALQGLTGAAGKAIGGVVNNIRPAKKFDKIFNTLGGGKNIEENAISLANRVGRSFVAEKTPLSARYQALENQFGHKDITEPESMGGYTKAPMVEDISPGSSIEEKFNTNPTYKNARDLISQLKTEERKLEGIRVKNPSKELDNDIQALKMKREKLEGDTYNFLKRESPEHAQELKNINMEYAKNVGPYYGNPTISKIARALDKKEPDLSRAKVDLSRLNNIFKSPQSKQDIATIAQHLGPQGVNEIIFAQLGKAKNAKDLIKKFETIEDSHFASYVPKELKNEMGTLRKMQRNKNFAKIGAIATGAIGIGAAAHLPLLEELVLGGLGGYGAAKIPELTSGSGGKKGLIMRGISNVPRLTQQAIIAELLAHRGQQ